MLYLKYKATQSMKTIYAFFTLLCVSLLWTGAVKAQVTVSPVIFTSTQSVTLTYDATLSQGQQLKDLPANVTTITAHVGAIIDNTTSTSWTNVPGTWGDPNAQPKFTRTGTSNIYTLSLPNGVRSMFPSLPANTPLYRVGMVLRENGPCGNFGGNSTACKEGKSTTEQDIFLDVNQGGLAIAVTSPTSNNFFVNNGDNITITANTNISATMRIFLNNVEIETANNATTITDIINVSSATAQYSVKITANDGTTTVEKIISFVLRQDPTIATLPNGTRLGVNYLTATSARLAFLAPLKSKVYILGDFNDWQLNANYLMKKDGETHWLDLTGLTSGTEYAYQFAVYDASENQSVVCDPFAELVLDPANDQFIPNTIYPNIKPYPTGKTTGVVAVLQTGQTAYPWSDATLNFVKPDKRNLVIYEAWVYDFNTSRDFQGIIDKLDYLEDLGINALQLMPVMEFDGNISWGYNPRFYCAVDKAYGTRAKFRELIDECHQRGIAVILDIVLNHAQEEYTYVKMYPANNNPMYNQNATHPFNVFRDMNHDSQYTKTVMKAINEYWIREYKIDGYRFDLAKGFTQNTQCANKEDVGCWSNYHQDRVDTWKRIADEIWAVDPTSYVVLENLAADNEEEAMAKYRADENPSKGMLLWQNMEGNYAENIMGKNTNTANISRVDFAERGLTVPHAIAYMESHDEERVNYKAKQNGDSSNTNHNVKNTPIGLERTKAAAAMLFPTPGPKMLWQFGELGFDFSINRCENGTINNDCRLSPKPQPWISPQNYDTNADRIRLYKVFAEIIKLKVSSDVFKSTDVSVQSNQGGSQYKKQIKVTPTTYTPTPANINQMNVVIIANFDVNPQSVTADFHHTGNWYHFFDGGLAYNVAGNTSVNITLQPGEFRIYTDFQLPATEDELTNYVRPKAATGITATGQAGCTVKIDWTDNSSIETGYKIIRSTAVNGTYTQVGTTTNVNVTTFTDATVSSNTTYYYKVVAVGTSSERESVADEATVPADTAPTSPTNVTATSPTTALEANLSWTASTGATKYRIERATSVGGTYTVIASDVTATTYKDVNVTLGQEYFYKVCAVNACGTATCANAVNTTVTSIEDNALARSIELFPNPNSAGKVNLQFKQMAFKQLEIRIMDMRGKPIKAFEVRGIQEVFELDLQNLPKGMYLIQFLTDKGTALKRLVKN
jgi:1,4-alpha-glucan branching enzyme